MLKNPIDQRQVPVAAVNFIKTHQLPHPILNAFSEGAYLMYAFSKADGSTEHLVPIDGRTNLISKELWSNYSKALLGEENWQEYIKMVNPQTILWPQKSPFNALLLIDSKWCRVFRSGDSEKGFSVFVRREYLATNSELARKGCI
ncbi:MAG: hypothetical protein GYA55_09265 [SAR324 cluster bacterium]|uniref:Uncharacterized protein n=1 Tax=SAR324 cluster bacterium TaxID=2024889 RepID=A0A7X9IKM1_9DELT|nr:hypothetical protein [SAR324 cluster bacterium]